MSNRAQTLLINARESWPALLNHRRSFATCGDGELAEGYSDAVAKLFAQRWNEFGTFVAIAKKNPSFKKRVIRHIDATASDHDLNQIVINADTCINDMKVANLCKAIRRGAENALIELTKMQRQSGQ